MKRYVYFWADGIYSNVRMGDRLCLLVIIGVTEHGHKELVAVEDGLRESESSWIELLMGLRARGLSDGPKLAVGDGSLGFWQSARQVLPGRSPSTVLGALPKSVHPKAKDALHEIWMAETRDEAHTAFNRILVRFEAKYPRTMAKLIKGREELLAFYDFPAEHWVNIRTTNPIESTFSTVRLRTKRARNCGLRETTLAMLYKRLESAQKKWKRPKGLALLTLVVNNVKFKDGVQEREESDRNAA